MLDAAGIAHAGGTDDDLGIVVLQDRLGLLCRDGQPQARESNGVDSLADQRHSLLVIAFIFIFQKDLRCLHRQRTVHIDGEIFVVRHHIVLLDLPQIIEHDLGPSHRKGGDDNISASGKGIPEDLGEFLDRRRPVPLVQTVAVGGLHDDIIRRIRQRRILEQRLVLIADIARENDLFLRASLGEPQLHAGRSEKVSDIGESEAHAVAERIDLPVLIGRDQADQIQCVLHGINRFKGLLISAALLSLVFPLRLHGLDMRGITQHDIAQTRCRLRRDDLSAESVLVECGQHTCMINMCMCHNHEIDPGSRNRQRGVLIFHAALPHAAVYQYILAADL